MTLLPPLEADLVVSSFVRAHPAVQALGARVAGETPTTRTQPWVRVTLLTDGATSNVDHHLEALLQLDCYAGTGTNTQARASAVRKAVRQALNDMPGSTLTGAVCTGTDSSAHYAPDDELGEPALARYIVTATCWMHPR